MSTSASTGCWEDEAASEPVTDRASIVTVGRAEANEGLEARGVRCGCLGERVDQVVMRPSELMTRFQQTHKQSPTTCIIVDEHVARRDTRKHTNASAYYCIISSWRA